MIAFESTWVDVELAPRPEYAGLFPLPLAPFECFMLHDERPGYSMVFYVEMVFLGRMDFDALTKAIQEAAGRHPLLLARLESDRRGLRWTLPAKAQIPLDFQDSDSPYVPPRGEAFDLRRESGLRIWVREDDERTSVTLQIHHACCDGEGSRHFGFDLLTGYARLTGESASPEWTSVEYDRLRARSNFRPVASGTPPARTTAWQKLRDAYHFHVLGPAPLAAPRPRDTSSPTGTPRPLMIKHIFSREETLQIKQRAAESEGAVNDVAIALLFQTLADWNLQYNSASTKQRLRILMPTDLRERSDRWLTAANRVGFSFLSRTIEQCREHQSLVAGIAQETAYIRELRLGLDFLQIMSAVQRVPYLLPALLRLPRCMATAVLTNLGDTTRRFRSRFPVRDGYPVIGNVRLEQVVGVPPLRPGTHSGIGICICAGHMAVSLRPDYSYLGNAAAASLLDAYVAAWKSWATPGDFDPARRLSAAAPS